MPDVKPPADKPALDALVLYRNRPARVKNTRNDRIEIEVDGGSRLVRPKDVTELHPGPLAGGDLASLEAGSADADIDTARELLEESGEGVDLPTLCDLLYDCFTPPAAWATWRILSEGLWFEGTPERIRARPAAAVAEERRRRLEAERERQAWKEFLQRLRSRTWIEEDERFLAETVQMARRRRGDSRALRALKRSESPENAHALLLEIGFWKEGDLPYPERCGAVLSPPPEPGPVRILEEGRVDLTHLEAWAIDDEGNDHPDDAVSFDPADGSVWVHVADVAAAVAGGSELDMEARGRGATLYMPHLTVPMLPETLIQRFGLGLEERSPALSFHLRPEPSGGAALIDIAVSTVAVTRLTYGKAELQLESGNDSLAALKEVADRSAGRRLAAGAVAIDWPEVDIRADAGSSPAAIDIYPLVRRASRGLVAELMILAGEGAAKYAADHGLPFPFVLQETVETPEDPGAGWGLAGALALRRRQLPARSSATKVGRHAGLGVEAYSRVTSPLRRYLDLVAHQQLRLHLRGERTLSETEIVERMGAAETAALCVRKAERMSRRHWTLAWLGQRPGWQGEAVVVDHRGSRAVAVIPDLALEIELQGGSELDLNEVVQVRLASVDLPRLESRFDLAGRGGSS